MSKNNNEENILWITSEMKSRDDENDEIVTEYNWIYYNGKNDFEYITKGRLNDNKDVIVETTSYRKGSLAKETVRWLSKNNGKLDESSNTSELYKDTTIILKGTFVFNDGSIEEYEKILQKEEVKDNITYLEILSKNDNILTKLTIYPDNKIVAEDYIDNKLKGKSEENEYYFQNSHVLNLTKSMFYSKSGKSHEINMYIKSEEMIDENTARIIVVMENEFEKDIREYILKKYQNVNGKLIMCEK